MSKSTQTSNQAAIAVANMVGQVGCAVSIASFVIIGVFFGIGYLLDEMLGTRPFLMLLMVVLSFPVTLYCIVRLSLSAVERANNLRERIESRLESEQESELTAELEDSAETENGKTV